MEYNIATLHAATGHTLLLPDWKGYFKWDYNTNELYFQNGDYKLTAQQLQQFKLYNRTDWYYII